MDTNIATRRENEEALIVPAVDIVEDEHGITLKADLPGVSKDDLSIGVDGENLTIEGTVKLGESMRVQALGNQLVVRPARFRERLERIRAQRVGPEVAVVAGRIRVAAEEVAEVRQAMAHHHLRRHAERGERRALERVHIGCLVRLEMQ